MASSNVLTSEYVDSGRGGYPSSTGMYGGGVSNGSPSTVSLEAQTMLVTAARRAALKTFQVQPMLFMKVRWSATLPGAGTAARCTTASSLSYLSSTPSIASSTWP